MTPKPLQHSASPNPVSQVLRRGAAMLAGAMVGTVGLSGLSEFGAIARAVQVGDGTVYFDRPPTLDNASTSFDRVRSWNARHYYTLTLAEDAGEPLQTLAINLYEPQERLRYRLDDSYSFAGTRWDRGEAIPLGNVSHDRETRTVTVEFDPPVEPGTTLTVVLRPVRNPMFPGVYLFGITAYPAGDRSYGQFLGYGRIRFYSGRDFGVF